jgi:hypothetical protein
VYTGYLVEVAITFSALPHLNELTERQCEKKQDRQGQQFSICGDAMRLTNGKLKLVCIVYEFRGIVGVDAIEHRIPVNGTEFNTSNEASSIECKSGLFWSQNKCSI